MEFNTNSRGHKRWRAVLFANLRATLLLGIAVAAGMPWWWSAFEGQPGVPVGAMLFFLVRPDRPKRGTP
jgi:hypothetical protein